VDRVLLLAGDAFTPPARTPWGGGRVAAWKRALGLEAAAPLGESWEVSFGELTSRIHRTGAPITTLVGTDFLGEERAGPALLVKLLDAGAPLSVQIHPRDDDPHLRPDESGKPECWYVVACEPGARIHFGLAAEANPAAMRAAIEGGADVSRLLASVEVEAGDFFVVPPGTPHAIGAGITVLEPQRVEHGRRGVTYRYWDWNRRYDAAGRLDPEGTLRPLHVEEALRVTDWSLRAPPWRRLGPVDLAAPARVELLSSLEGRGESIPFPVAVERLAGTGPRTLEAASVARALTVVEGHVELEGQRATRGQTLLIAAGFAPRLQLRSALALAASTPPR
jgi:mannose-6-phosphate isomerase class I